MKKNFFWIAILVLAILTTTWITFVKDATKFPDSVKEGSEEELALVNEIWDEFQSRNELSTDMQSKLFDKLIVIEPIVRTQTVVGYPLVVDLHFKSIAPAHFTGDLEISGDINGKVFKSYRKSVVNTVLQKEKLFSIAPMWNQQTIPLYTPVESLEEGEYSVNLKLTLLMHSRLLKGEKENTKKIIAMKEFNKKFQFKVINKLEDIPFRQIEKKDFEINIEVNPRAGTRLPNDKFTNQVTIYTPKITTETLSYKVTVMEKDKTVSEQLMFVRKDTPENLTFNPFGQSDPVFGKHDLKIILTPTPEAALKYSAAVQEYLNKPVEKEISLNVSLIK